MWATCMWTFTDKGIGINTSQSSFPSVETFSETLVEVPPSMCLYPMSDKISYVRVETSEICHMWETSILDRWVLETILQIYAIKLTKSPKNKFIVSPMSGDVVQFGKKGV